MPLPIGEFLQKISQKVASKLNINAEKMIGETLADTDKFVKVRSFKDLILGRFANMEIRNLFPALNVHFKLINEGAHTDALVKSIETKSTLF